MRLLRPLVLSFVLLAMHGIAHATVFCVETVSELRQALDIAESNGKDDFIHIARGTYSLNTTALSFGSTEAFSLNVTGGYDPGCAARIYDAALTVLDATNTSALLYVNTANDFDMRFLTLRRGQQADVVMNIDGSNSSHIVIANTIIADNQTTTGYLLYVDGGTVTLKNNLIAGNSSKSANFGVGGSIVEFTNNTLTGNILTDTNNPSRYTLLLGGPADASIAVSNNIFWGNNNGVDLYSNLNPLLIDNDYQRLAVTPGAGSGGNVNVDPQFAGSANFRLLPTSPLLNVGSIAPPGGVTTYDLQGNDRVLNGRIDLGAYQHGEDIFFDGFE